LVRGSSALDLVQDSGNGHGGGVPPTCYTIAEFFEDKALDHHKAIH